MLKKCIKFRDAAVSIAQSVYSMYVVFTHKKAEEKLTGSSDLIVLESQKYMKFLNPQILYNTHVYFIHMKKKPRSSRIPKIHEI